MSETDEIVKTILHTRILEALKKAPEAIDAMVKAALIDKKVDDVGRITSYSGMPYLEYLTGETIREAARSAVTKVVAEMQPTIEAQIRVHLSSEMLVSAMTAAFLKATKDSWCINVKFETEKDRY